eukprot:scaffold10593_cov66-Skeletonema_marinoi.AAC.1
MCPIEGAAVVPCEVMGLYFPTARCDDNKYIISSMSPRKESTPSFEPYSCRVIVCQLDKEEEAVLCG